MKLAAPGAVASRFEGILNRNPETSSSSNLFRDQAEDRSTTFSSGVVGFRAVLLAVTTTVAIVPVSVQTICFCLVATDNIEALANKVKLFPRIEE